MAHGWRAYYSDDSVHASTTTDPVELPKDGLLGVVEYLPFETPKRYTHTGYDWYFWWDGPDGLVIGGNVDPLEENERRYPGATFVRGKWTSHAHMREVRETMREAHEVP